MGGGGDGRKRREDNVITLLQLAAGRHIKISKEERWRGRGRKVGGWIRPTSIIWLEEEEKL